MKPVFRASSRRGYDYDDDDDDDGSVSGSSSSSSVSERLGLATGGGGDGEVSSGWLTSLALDPNIIHLLVQAYSV